MHNGLVQRKFRIESNAVYYDFINLVTGQQLIRAVKPEAKIQVNGKWYDIGGLHGQKENAYFLPEWLDVIILMTV